MTIRYTPTHSLPYPEGSDSVAPASRDFQSLAVATDAALTDVGTARLRQMADGTHLNTLDSPGSYSAFSWQGGPPGTGAGYVEVKTLTTGVATSVLQRFVDHETGRAFIRTRGTTGWIQWTRIDGMAEQRIAHALTRPLASLTETTPSRSVRIPFAVPARARQWRVVIRNVNYRTNTVYPGPGTLRTIVLGHGKRDENGDLTSSFGDWKRIMFRDVAVPDWGAGYVSPWHYDDLRPGTDYLLAFGYEHNGIETHRGMAGGWQTSGNPMNAELTNDPTAAKVTRLPFDVSIEYLTQDDTPTDVILGDSIAAASDASFPVHEAPLAIADRTTGRATRLYAFGGAALGEWIGPNWGDPASLKWQHVTTAGKADRAFIALGNNDINGTTNLTTLQANFTALVTLLKERVSSTVIACTVTPRTAWTGTSKETLRQAFNDWLRTYPAGISGVADLARAVETPNGDAPRADLVIGDGIHFNTAGSAALAGAIAAPVTTATGTGSQDTGLRVIAGGVNTTNSDITLCRVGNMVTLSVRFNVVTGAGTDNGILQLPAGFRPQRSFWTYLFTGTGPQRSCNVGTSGNLQTYGTVTGESLRTAAPLTFRTADPWPATLPGTPA